jgi:hypothetical protein
MELVIDADGHVLEPPDVWERYICHWVTSTTRMRADGSSARTSHASTG